MIDQPGIQRCRFVRLEDSYEGSGFKKQNFLCEWVNKSGTSEYPQNVVFTAMNAMIPKVMELRHGDEVTLHYTLTGALKPDRTGKSRCYQSVKVIKIER